MGLTTVQRDCAACDSNLAPRPRPYNLSVMNIVEVSAGNISPVYCLFVRLSICPSVKRVDCDNTTWGNYEEHG